MSYTVLARKWRPQVFEDVVGQGHITRTLQNAIGSGRLAHAFLFSGPRGVGKTTTARILAKALNCEKGPTPNPCGACDACRETTTGTAVDVIEIDGASNRGIEHIRELREAVKYAPVAGKYKVYVIDEVHMLTNEAFNALLKTLEEPPPHVIFLFATTEPQKIPATIHSRCQHYSFKRVTHRDIIGKLQQIAASEGISISERGLGMIARAADGSMRDSQSILDQAVSYSGLTVRDEDLQSMLGVVAHATLLRFADLLLASDAAGLVKELDTLIEQGQDLKQFLMRFVEHLRNLIVVKILKDPGQGVELSASDQEAVVKQSAAADAEFLLMLFDSLIRTQEELRRSPHQRFTLEIGLIRACKIGQLQPLGELVEAVEKIEARLARHAAAPSAAVRIAEPGRPYRTSAPPVRHAAPTAGGQGDPWKKVLSLLRSKKPRLATMLEHSVVQEQTADGLQIGVRGSFNAEQAGKPENVSIIEQVAAETLGRTVRVHVRMLADDAPQHKEEAARKTLPRKAAQGDDPLAHNIARLFEGEVIDVREQPPQENE